MEGHKHPGDAPGFRRQPGLDFNGHQLLYGLEQFIRSSEHVQHGADRPPEEIRDDVKGRPGHGSELGRKTETFHLFIKDGSGVDHFLRLFSHPHQGLQCPLHFRCSKGCKSRQPAVGIDAVNRRQIFKWS